MIGKRIMVTIGGLAVLVIVTGFLLGSLIAKKELAAYQTNSGQLDS